MVSEILVNVAIECGQAFTQLSVSRLLSSFNLSKNYSFIRIQTNQIKAILYLKSSVKTGTVMHSRANVCWGLRWFSLNLECSAMFQAGTYWRVCHQFLLQLICGWMHTVTNVSICKVIPQRTLSCCERKMSSIQSSQMFLCLSHLCHT